MSDETIAVGLAGLWAVAGIAAVVILTRAGLHALRGIRADRENRELDQCAAALVASRLDAIDDSRVLEDEQKVEDSLGRLAAQLEDHEVAALDAIWGLPVYRRRETA